MPILHFLRHCLKKNNDERVSLQCALLCFLASFLFFPSLFSLFLCDFLLYRVLIRLRKRRKQPEDTGTMEIGNGKKERCNTSTSTSQAFSVLHSIRAFRSLPRPRDCR